MATLRNIINVMLMVSGQRVRWSSLSIVLLVTFVSDSALSEPLLLKVHPASAASTHPPMDPLSSQETSVTLTRALEIARRARETNPKVGPITIELAPGVYRLDYPIELGVGDSGSADAPLVIRGERPGLVKLVGSRALGEDESIKIPSAYLDALPERSRGRVRALHLDAVFVERLGEEKPRKGTNTLPVPAPAAALEVSQDGELMKSARWPTDGYARSDSVEFAPTSSNPRISVPPSQLRAWAGEHNLWAGGFWGHDWAYETLRVRQIDVEKGQMEIPKTEFTARAGLRYFVYNAVSELDSPGEYVFDKSAGLLLVWPFREDVRSAPLEIAATEKLLRTRNASNIRLEHLVFDMAREDAITLENSRNIVITDCIVANTGGRGIVIDGGAGNRIERTVVIDSGETGIVLSGGNRPTLKPSRHVVRDSVVARFGRLLRARPGIQLAGVGQVVEGSLITDGPHAAIIFSGNDHMISNNEISNVVNETSDVGAVYAGRDWTARGTIIADNYIHDVRPWSGRGIANEPFGVKGVYFDDFLSGNSVRNNLFINVMRPIFIGGGRDNKVSGNIFLNSGVAAIHIDDRGQNWAAAEMVDPKGEMQERLAAVPYRREPFRSRYPELVNILDDEPGVPKNNQITSNIVLGSPAFEFEGSTIAALQTIHAVLDDKSVKLLSPTAPPILPGNLRLRSTGDEPLRPPFARPFGHMDRRKVLSALGLSWK